MRRLFDFVVFQGVLLVEFLARSLSPQAAAGMAEACGRVWYWVDGRRRARARESLRIARAGGLAVSDPEALVKASLGSLMWVPLEVMTFPRYLRTARDAIDRCRFYGDWAGFARDLAAGRGGVVLAGHLGSWELAGWVLRFLHVNVRVVARPIENPWIDRRAVGARGGRSRVITKRGAVREMVRTLREGGWLGIVADQNAGTGGRFVEFFGLEASTYAAPAVVALRAGVPVWAAACLRRKHPPFTYELRLRRLPDRRPDATEPEATQAVLRAYHEALEGWIRLAPEQYNWVHRRWKTRPEGERAGPRVPRYDRRSLTARAGSPV